MQIEVRGSLRRRRACTTSRSGRAVQVFPVIDSALYLVTVAVVIGIANACGFVTGSADRNGIGRYRSGLGLCRG
jgi:hypothetical protein